MSYADAQSLVNGTIEEAIDKLAKRASVARLLRDREKQAAESMDYSQFLDPEKWRQGGSWLQRQMALNPAMTATLAGAGVGAGIGGLSSFGTEKKRRNTLSSTITGGIAGAGIGGGGYLASRMIPQLHAQLSKSPDSFTFDGGGDAGDPARKLDPAAVRNSPELIKEVDRLRTRSPVTQAIGASAGFVGNYSHNHPLLATILAGDVGSQVLGTGSNILQKQVPLRADQLRATLDHLSENESLKDKANKLRTAASDFSNEHLQSTAAKTRAGRGLFNLEGGVVHSNKDELTQGVSKTFMQQLEALLQPKTKNMLDAKDALGAAKPAIPMGDVYASAKAVLPEALKNNLPNGPTLHHDELTDAARHALGPMRRGGLNAAANLFEGAMPDSWLKGISNYLPKSLQDESIGEVRKKIRMFGTGFSAEGKPNPGILSSAARKFETTQNPFGTGWQARTLPRLALYGGVPLLQQYLRTAGQETDNQHRLQELIQQLSKSVK